MANDLVVVYDTSPAMVQAFRGNYNLTIWDGRKFQLERDVDFGKPNAKIKQPILYKAGAEKVRWEYGVFDRYALVNSIQDVENGFFMYTFKCELVKVLPDGKEVVVSEGYGSANTRESNVGAASGFDVANSKLKIAEKRAMVDAVIKMARLSSIFTQDMENDDFMGQAGAIMNEKGTDPITPKQRQRIFAIAANAGMNTEQCRNWLKANGFASTKDIKQDDYDGLCEKLKGVPMHGAIGENA
jgi:hypothetical protein